MKQIFIRYIPFVMFVTSACLGLMLEDFESYQDSEQLNELAPLYLPNNFGYGRAVATLETDYPYEGQKCVRFYRSGYPNYTQFGFRFTGDGFDMSEYAKLRLRFRGNPNHSAGYNLGFIIKDRYANDIISQIQIPDGARAEHWQTIEVPITSDPRWANVGFLQFTDRKDDYGFTDIFVDSIELVPHYQWNDTVKTYGILSQGKFYKFSHSPHSAYPDIYPCLHFSDGSLLTDELIDQWVGWFNSSPIDIILDLGKVYDINLVKLKTKSETNAGVSYPEKMNIFIREDSAGSWQEFGNTVYSPGNTSQHSQTWLTAGDAKTTARYVKYSLSPGEGNVLVSQIEVYGDIVNEVKYAPDFGFYNAAFPVTHQGWLNINRHETITGQRLSMVLWYHELNPNYGGSGFESIASLWNHNNGLGRNQANHRYLTIGWLPRYSTAAEIATGEDGYDAHFEQWFEKSIDYSLRGGNTDPIWLRPMNEMNGTWAFPGNTSSPISQWGGDPLGFRRAWRRIYNIAEQVGAADEHIFLWAPNGITYPPQEWNMPDKYYPGDSYVDWIGISLYVQGQDGKKYPNNILTGDSGAGSFDFISNWTYKPLMIAEGCWRSTSQDTDGVRWVNEWFDMAHNYPRMKAAVWFHYQKNPNDPEDQGRSDMEMYPAEVLETFQQRLAERYYIKDPVGGWLDYNKDGFIDIDDFIILADSWLENREGVQCFINNNGIFVAEAENAHYNIDGTADFEGSWVAVESGSAINGMFMQAESDNTEAVLESELAMAPRLSFNLWFANPGDYYVHFRGGGSDTNQTGFWFAIDGDSPQLYSFTPFSTLILRWYNSGKFVTINQPGLYRFDVWMGRAGVKLDRILLTDNPTLSLPEEPAESLQFQSPINIVDINEDYVVDYEDFAVFAEYFGN